MSWVLETGPAARCRRHGVTTTAEPAVADSDARFARQFTAEWLALLFALGVVGVLIVWTLFKSHEALPPRRSKQSQHQNLLK